MEVVIASHNRAKIKEIEEIVNLPELSFCSMADKGFHEEIVEDSESYQGNALIKARAVYQALGGYVLADDSGLSLDVLDGYPGIYSARFAGETSSYPDKIEALWQLLKPYPKETWTGAFHCALAFIEPDGSEHCFTGTCPGLIIDEMRGQGGFGYDPIFYLPAYGLTTAELTAEEKNRISHRGLAMRAWRDFIVKRVFSGGYHEAD